MARALCTAAAIAFLAACSNGAQTSGGNTSGAFGPIQQSSVHHQAHYAVVSAIPKGSVRVRNPHLRFDVGPDAFVKGGVYAGQFSASVINEYGLPNKHNKAPRCTDGPTSAVNGLGYDSTTRTLWDPDGGTRTLIPFKKNCGGAGTPISEANGQPSDIAVDGNTLYVADNSASTIDIYTGGVYTGSLSNGACSTDFVDAVDQHNVFEACQSDVITEYPGGTGGGTVLGITGMTLPGGITFDNAHNLIVVDLLANEILVYAPPYSGAPTSSGADVGESTYVAINAANTALYVGDFANSSIDVYSYPSLAYEYSITNGLTPGDDTEGVAVDSQGHQATP
jgi:hypothetical protein